LADIDYHAPRNHTARDVIATNLPLGVAKWVVDSARATRATRVARAWGVLLAFSTEPRSW
jgi:hypothetical protein